MTIVTLVGGCGNAYPGDGTRDTRRPLPEREHRLGDLAGRRIGDGSGGLLEDKQPCSRDLARDRLGLAESMELPLRQRNELLLAAGFAPAFPESRLDDEALRPVRRALDTILDGHLPYPTMVVRHHGILVTAEQSAAEDRLDCEQVLGRPHALSSEWGQPIRTSTDSE